MLLASVSALAALCALLCPQSASAQGTAYTLSTLTSGNNWTNVALWTPSTSTLGPGNTAGDYADLAILPLGNLSAAWNMNLNSSPTIAGLSLSYTGAYATTLNAGTPTTSSLTFNGAAPAITNTSGQTLTINSVVNLNTANAILTCSNNGTIYLVNPGVNFFPNLNPTAGLTVDGGTLHLGNVTNGVPQLSTAKTGPGTLQLDLAAGSTFFTNQPSLGGTGERIITGVVSFTNASGGAQTLVNNSTGVLDLQLNPAVSATNFLASLSAVSSISGMNGILDLENLNGTNNLGNLSISTSAANGNFNVLNNSGGNLVNLITGGSFNTGSGTLGLCGGIIFNVDSNNVGFNVGTLVVSSANGGWLYRGGAVTVNWNASGKSLGAVQMCNQGGGPAIFNLLGGSLANTAAFTLGNTGHDYDNSTSTLNVSGGVLAITNSGGLQMSFVTTAPSGSTGPQEYSFLTITNTGVLSIISPGALKAGAVTVSDTATAPIHSESTISLGGGALQLEAPIARQPVATMVNGSSANWVQFFFNGGTLQATTELPQVFTGFGTVNSTADAVYVASGGAVINNGGFTVGISNNLLAASGSTGGLTNLGSGTLTLSGANTYTGATTTSAGKLITTTASTFGSPFYVADGATNQVVVVAPGQTLNLNKLTLGASAGATLEFNNAGFANPSAPIVVVNGALTLNGTITVNVYGTALAAGPAITLLTYAAKSGTGSFVLGSLPAGVNATLTDTGTQLQLAVNSLNTSLVWRGNVGSVWDINDSVNTNWLGLPAAVAVAYNESSSVGLPVTFDDTATGTTKITLGVTVNPANVTINNSALNYSITGAGTLASPIGLTKNGTGNFTLGVADNFTNAIINGGVLDCQINAALGNGGATVNAGGEVACDANVSLTNALTLAGGTISFNGNNGAFSGPVTLAGDSTIALRSFTNRSAASGALSNAITATANTLTVAGGGTLTFASGSATSTLNMLRLTNSTATLASGTLNLNTGGTPGNTSVTGGSGFNNFGGSTFTVNGGTLALAGNYFIPAGNDGGGNNVFTLQSGNVVNNGGEVLLAYAANGTLNVNGGTFNNNSQSIRVQQGATGVVNLNGGVLALNQFDNAGGVGGTVYFNGGTLRANVNGASLLQSHNAYVVKTGGAVMDSQGYSVSVDVPLTSGSSPDGGLKKVGSGTLTLSATNAYNGPTTLSAGTLAMGVNALITGTSSLLLNSGSTLLFALNAPSGPTNIMVNGSVTLAGQINVSDSGIVANSVYPVIYYTGNLTNNGVTVAALSPWAFTIDTSVPHLVRLLVGQKYPLLQMTNPSFGVSTTTTNLGGILHGAPALPLWYEVRDQTNRLWDYGSTLAVSPWSITVRHLNAGTNTVTVFAQDTTGNITSNSVQLTLTLGAAPGVRPRPQPSEIWWGGSCHQNLYNNGTIVGTYSALSQLLQTNGWDFCKRYQDGFFLHGYVWVNAAAQMTNWQAVGTSISAQLAPFNGKYWLEDSWYAEASNMNYGVSSAGGQTSDADTMLGVGFALSEITQDFNADWGDFSNWHPDWLTNDLRVLITGNTNQASTNYPYASGQWRDYANHYRAARPNIKFGWTWSPVWWHWRTGASLGTDSGIFTVTSNGTNYNFDWDFYDFMNDAVAVGNQAGVPFAFASDCPWEYYMQYPGNPGGWTQAQQLANRVKIRNYEAWLQTQNLRHTMICNSQSTSSDTNTSDLNYETRSLAVMCLHQQEGGRAWRYSFESWYSDPYAVLPETQAGSYTHLALSAIKYLKGIADTNGDLEPLNITPLATNGTVQLLQLQNNGDVQCLPALAGQIGTVPGVTTRYFTTNGAELTATMLTAEGLCYTNMLQPGATTNLFAVTLAGGISSATNDNASLEAFWNPQDPLGIVRDREFFATLLSPPGLWNDADIGNPGVTGGSASSGTNFTLLGSGADVWGAGDAFHFFWQTNNGNGTITARITSQVAADPWSKAGVMVRASTATNAQNVFVCVTPGNGVSFQNRVASGGATVNTDVSGPVAPYWLRLTGSNSTFTAYCSSNGVNWVTVGSASLTGFPSSALWGLAVTAHNNGLASAATFDNVALPNVAPTLAAISNRTVTAGQTLTVTNTATDSNSPPQTLTFSLPVAPTGAVINATNGLLTWRPTISQSPTTNQVSVAVTDSGVPPLGATQSFMVTVLRPATPTLVTPVMTSNLFSLQVNGSSGPDYVLLGATNLTPPVNWQPLKTNLSATPPFTFTDPATNRAGKLYRVQLGP